MLRDSTPRFVGPSVGPSVRQSVGALVRQSLGPSVTLCFFFFLRFLALLFLPKGSSDLKNSLCPPASDLVSRVSGLVSYIIICFNECSKLKSHDYTYNGLAPVSQSGIQITEDGNLQISKSILFLVLHLHGKRAFSIRELNHSAT